jgi:hypothetical protein
VTDKQGLFMAKVMKTIGQTVVMAVAVVFLAANDWANQQPDSPDGPSPNPGHPVCCGSGPPSDTIPSVSGKCTSVALGYSGTCPDGQPGCGGECDTGNHTPPCGPGEINVLLADGVTHYCHNKNYNHMCGSASWYGNCTPEMSDYLALTLVLAIAGRIYYFRRRSQAAA